MFAVIATEPTEKVIGAETGPVAADQVQAPAADLPWQIQDAAVS